MKRTKMRAKMIVKAYRIMYGFFFCHSTCSDDGDRLIIYFRGK